MKKKPNFSFAIFWSVIGNQKVIITIMYYLEKFFVENRQLFLYICVLPWCVLYGMVRKPCLRWIDRYIRIDIKTDRQSVHKNQLLIESKASVYFSNCTLILTHSVRYSPSFFLQKYSRNLESVFCLGIGKRFWFLDTYTGLSDYISGKVRKFPLSMVLLLFTM